MKIALVCPYDFAYPGGVQSHIYELDLHLARQGHDVRVIAPASGPVEQFGDRFIPIGRPYSIPSSESIIRIPISLRLANTIKEVLAREKFDVLHLHEPFMPMLCSAVLRLSDTANVGTFHAAQGKPGYNWGKPISTWMLRRRLHKLHCKIAVSRAAMRYASKAVPGPYEIIPNGIDLGHFTEDIVPIEEFCDDKQNILFLGRLEFRKGLNYLLKAFLRIKPEVPDTRLIVVGPGTRLRKRYEKWVRKHNLQDDVIFTGFVPYEDKTRYYKTADIFCAPATGRESFGIVLLEAMAVGKPVVGTNIEGYASVVTHHEDGLLVPPQDDVELARSLLVLLKDEALRKQMGERGKSKAREYGWDVIGLRVVDCYQRAIEEFNGRKSTNL